MLVTVGSMSTRSDWSSTGARNEVLDPARGTAASHQRLAGAAVPGLARFCVDVRDVAGLYLRWQERLWAVKASTSWSMRTPASSTSGQPKGRQPLGTVLRVRADRPRGQCRAEAARRCPVPGRSAAGGGPVTSGPQHRGARKLLEAQANVPRVRPEPELTRRRRSGFAVKLAAVGRAVTGPAVNAAHNVHRQQIASSGPLQSPKICANS